MESPIILKLGGSVVTHKGTSPPTINEQSLLRIAEEIKSYKGKVVIVLGGGAHGHQAAHLYGFGNHSTPKNQLLAGIPHIRHNMSLLALEVETVLSNKGISAIVIPPFTVASLQNESIQDFSLSIMKRALQNDFTVLTHGDVCFDEERGASILSGDTLVVYLAQQLDAKSVYIGTDVDGVLDDDPNLNPAAKHIPLINHSNKEEILSKTGPSMSTDVTGGMTKKVGELLELARNDRDIVIFNLTVPNRLKTLLLGNPIVCTRIMP